MSNPYSIIVQLSSENSSMTPFIARERHLALLNDGNTALIIPYFSLTVPIFIRNIFSISKLYDKAVIQPHDTIAHFLI